MPDRSSWCCSVTSSTSNEWGRTGQVNDQVTATLMRPEYAELFDSLRRFRGASAHHVTYVIGNHDAELWWNLPLQRLIRDHGLVDEFALSYAARFESLDDQLIYGEHGNQFDPTNRFTDYSDPLDTPIGAHVVDQIVRPIGSGVRLTGNLDLRDVSFVFPLTAIPRWIAGRIFYRFLDEALRWILVVFVIANIVHVILMWTGPSDDQQATVRTILVEVAYDIGVLVLIGAVVFLVSRRTAHRAVSALALHLAGAPSAAEPAAIRTALLTGRGLSMGGGIDPRSIAVFVTGHTHAPSSTRLRREDDTLTVVVNTGCWLRQLQPVRARFGAPDVFVPVFVQSHVRVQRSREGVVAELWHRPKAAPRRLPWIERTAIAGRIPNHSDASAKPLLLDRQLVVNSTDASR
jgi:hypothetical protein